MVKTDTEDAAASTRPAPRILLVGDLRHKVNGSGTADPDLRVVDFSEVDGALLASFAPDFVISPLVTPGFDVLDLADRLWRARFTGAYRALAEAAVADPGLIVAEVQTRYPGLDIQVLRLEPEGSVPG